METIKIQLIEDQELMREGIVYQLKSMTKEYDFSLMPAMRSAKEWLSGLSQSNIYLPDVLLLDMYIKGEHSEREEFREYIGVDVISEIRKQKRDIKILVLSIAVESNYKDNILEEIQRLGADGCCHKDISREKLLALIWLVYDREQGEEFIDGRNLPDFTVKQTLKAHKKLLKTNKIGINGNYLTSKQSVIFKLTAQTLSSEEIADLLSTSKENVDQHKNSIKDILFGTKERINHTRAYIQFSYQNDINIFSFTDEEYRNYESNGKNPLKSYVQQRP